jgi:hypothetical protein
MEAESETQLGKPIADLEWRSRTLTQERCVAASQDEMKAKEEFSLLECEVLCYFSEGWEGQEFAAQVGRLENAYARERNSL